MRQGTNAVRWAAACTALAALSAGHAQAQSNVTIYGIVDVGLQYTSDTPDGGSEKEVYNAGISPNILGFKGREDLGAGLGAVFNLEMHFSSATGETTQRLWRRQANVGLTGGWGTALLGVQYSPAVLALAGTDPRGIKEQLSGLYAFALNQVGGSVNSDLGIFLTNSVSYSNSFGPVDFGIAYSASDGDRHGNVASVGATFKGPNSMKFSGYYQEVDGDGSGALGDDTYSKQFGIGAAMPFGPATIKLQYINSQVDDQGTAFEISDTDTWAIGADFAWGGRNTATIAYYNGKNKAIDDDRTGTLIISNDYAMSKRTTLYAQFAYIDAKDGATGFTSVGSNAVVPDNKTTIFGVGINHKF